VPRKGQKWKRTKPVFYRAIKNEYLSDLEKRKENSCEVYLNKEEKKDDSLNLNWNLRERVLLEK